MTDHICKESTHCTCYQLADEPNENCAMHGIIWPPRCGDCGKFMSGKTRNQREVQNENSDTERST